MAHKTLEELVQWYDASEEQTLDSRNDAARDRRYYNGKQWSADEIATLNKRGQPVVTFNRIAPKVNFLLGHEQQTRTMPKAFPRTPKDDDDASPATDAIRYVCDSSNWSKERSCAFSQGIIEGVFAGEVRVEPDGKGGVKVVIGHVPYDRVFWDPRSRYDDFRDAKYMGTVTWLDSDDALLQFPDAKEVIDMASSHANESATSETFSDRPHMAVWADMDRNRPRVKIVQMWWNIGTTWHVATFTKSGFLEPCIESPYVDYEKKSLCGLILQSAFVDEDNNRYGIIRDLISPQDEINHRRSKSLHHLNTRNVVMEEGAVESPREAMQELAKADGVVVRRSALAFEIIPNDDRVSGHLQLMQEAKQEIDSIGSNAALTGDDPRSQSGVALQARQKGGIVELGWVMGNFKQWQHSVYRAVWHRIQQFWTGEMWVRVTDDERNVRFVGLNRPVTMAEEMQKRGMQLPDPSTLHPAIQQQLQQVVRVENPVAELDVDIVLDESPDVVTFQEEQFQALSQILPAIQGSIPPQVLVELVIEMSGLRNKTQLLERIKSGGATPEQQQQAAQEQQKQQQIQQQALALDFGQKQADIHKTQAEVEKTMADAQLKQAQAENQQTDSARMLFEPFRQPAGGGDGAKKPGAQS